MVTDSSIPSFPGHSTETAFLLALNSIYTSADSGHATLLVST